jgi:AraC-like DNA-binding protein
MHRSFDDSSAIVREHWLAAVVRATQELALRSIAVDTDEVRAPLTQFIDDIPNATTPVERLVLRGLLLDAAFHFGRTVHRLVHGGRGESCDFVPAAIVDRCWETANEPDAAFRRWIDAFSAAFACAHPPTTASRAARLIRIHYDEQWSVDRLARRLHLTPSHLRREFQRQFGMSVHQYRERVRVREAAMKIRNEKVDAQALRVGYRSRTNLYAAFRRVTGLSLTAFRQLSDESALHVLESIGSRPPRRDAAADRLRR